MVGTAPSIHARAVQAETRVMVDGRLLVVSPLNFDFSQKSMKQDFSYPKQCLHFEFVGPVIIGP